MKLLSKERIGSKTIKHHDPPKTPYQRIMESPHTPDHTKQKLTKQLQNLNLFSLRQAMESKLKKSSTHAIKTTTAVNDPHDPFGNIYL